MTDKKNENKINYYEYDTIFDSGFWYDWKEYAKILFIIVVVCTVLRIIWLLLTLLFKLG